MEKSRSAAFDSLHAWLTFPMRLFVNGISSFLLPSVYLLASQGLEAPLQKDGFFEC